MNTYNTKNIELNSLLGINVHKKFEKEVVERIKLFFQSKIIELSQTHSGLDLVKLVSTYVTYENTDIIYIWDNKINLFKNEIISSLDPIWYLSEKSLLSKNSDMIDYIFWYLKNKPDSKFFISNCMVKPFSYGLPGDYRSPYTQCFVNANKVSVQTNDLKFSYSKKFNISYFNERAFEQFKEECIITYTDELQKTFNYYCKPSHVPNLSDHFIYKEIFKHLKRDFDISDLEEILKISTFNFKNNAFCSSAARALRSSLYILINLPSVPCLK